MSRDGLRIDELRAALAGHYAAVDVVASTGSTNADLLDAAARGAADRTVLIAEEQTAGRGRLMRDWVSPPGAGLYLSVLLRTDGVRTSRLGGLAVVVVGVALVRAAASAGVDAVLKWPNDLLAGADRGKCGGVLGEVLPGGGGVVVGIGLNVAPLPVEVPPGPGGLPATSLAQAGATTTDRTAVAITLLTGFAQLEADWRKAGGDLTAAAGILTAYRDRCATLGQPVRVELSGGEALSGVAADVDADGRLLLTADDGARTTVSAGDVVHLR